MQPVPTSRTVANALSTLINVPPDSLQTPPPPPPLPCISGLIDVGGMERERRSRQRQREALENQPSELESEAKARSAEIEESKWRVIFEEHQIFNKCLFFPIINQ